MKKTLLKFFLDSQENETMMKIVNLSIDFRNRSPMRKGIFLYFNDCKIKKSSWKKRKKRNVFSKEKIYKLKKNLEFYFSDVEKQLKVFLGKLHQGSLDEIKKNSFFLKDLEKLVLRGGEILLNSQNFSQRKFLCSVFTWDFAGFQVKQ